ncbi:YT521-B-like domain-containing protein [Melanogaster broomeanus]|nr:YT521-B-like domain-containing protein [Melanogaster broomeanus]
MTQKHSQGPPASSARRSQPTMQTNPPVFAPVPLMGQRHLQRQDHQAVPGNLGTSASLSHGALPLPMYPMSPPPSQPFASTPPYTHRSIFTGQYPVSSQHPFQNPPPQSYLYARTHGYHPHPGLSPEPSQFQQNPHGHLPVLQHHVQPYFQHHSTAEGIHPAYHHASPLPALQPAASSTTTPHPGLYGGQQYSPLHYSPSRPFAYPQHYQPSPGPYQWYYLPSPSAPPFNEGVPVQFQHHFPVNYPQPQTQQSLHGDSEMRGAPSTERFGPQAHGPTQVGADGNARSPSLCVEVRASRTQLACAQSQRSEWVMWVGNVPGDVTHDELWRFLKRPEVPTPSTEGAEVRDDGVTSIFLISRSNCAFVNFDSEEQSDLCDCSSTSKEDDLRAGVGAQRGAGVHTQYVRKIQSKDNEPAEDEEDCGSISSFTSEAPRPQLAPLGSSEEEAANPQFWEGRLERSKAKTRSHSSYASTTSSFLAHNFPKRFFILKSLTQYDLDLSVERGLWATQKHNETILDQAYRTSKEVILVFGVNKSGEFYGYARMSSRILHSEHNVSWASRADSLPSSSHSSIQNHRQAHGTSGEPESPLRSRGSPLTYFTPSERGLIESPPEFRDASDGSKHFVSPPGLPHVGLPQERQSAPAAFGRQTQGELSADVSSPKSSRSYNLKGWPSAARPAKEPVVFPSREIELDKNAPVRAMRERGEDSGTPLRPVEEEKQNDSGAEEEVGGGGVHLTAPGEEATRATPDQLQTQTQGDEGRDTGWGETFKIEWLCTARLPFHRARHLRNPWNHDREIKVSRDGTELEPGVGQQLIEEWLTLAADGGEADPGRAARSNKRDPKGNEVDLL